MVSSSRDYNPFSNIDLHIPAAFLEDVRRYAASQSGEGEGSQGILPFRRYVDLWTLAIAIGAAENNFMTLSSSDQHRFIQGSVLQGDVSRIEFLQLIAIAHAEDPYVISDPRRVIEIADGYAAGGIQILLDWLISGTFTPIQSLTKNLLVYSDEKTRSQ
ncbi:hypothetical protein [Acidithrix ferrooxidans]|uniref:Dnd system-associated protein 4 n=1 Tax=Acidithrix ferrooxidans TaxID=1280514 RepID=A0A0D8HGD7_9ACTN|nr:hypothetical protein [Acidithrix ferrooxidans]KJF16151.1 hypothetical protein AXFE_29990 [Acidithrix ferrooxidans]